MINATGGAGAGDTQRFASEVLHRQRDVQVRGDHLDEVVQQRSKLDPGDGAAGVRGCGHELLDASQDEGERRDQEGR